MIFKSKGRAGKFLKDVRERSRSFFLEEDGGKTVLNLKRVFIFLGPVFFLLVVTTILMTTQEDSSFLGKTDKKIMENDISSDVRTTHSPAVHKILGPNDISDDQNKKTSRRKVVSKINYKAAQVISRDGGNDPARSVPIGTNMIGKTLTAIDTRESNQTIKILLPYGAKSKLGPEIQKGTILFGQVLYSGKGRKVSVVINKGLSPDEQEFDIEAQVLDPANYSVGLTGESNSQSDLRILSVLGLSVASGAAEIMVERESANGLGQSLPRANLGNAASRGLSQSMQEEANRQAEKYQDAEDYLTLPAGSDVIVSLTKSYVEK